MWTGVAGSPSQALGEAHIQWRRFSVFLPLSQFLARGPPPLSLPSPYAPGFVKHCPWLKVLYWPVMMGCKPEPGPGKLRPFTSSWLGSGYSENLLFFQRVKTKIYKRTYSFGIRSTRSKAKNRIQCQASNCPSLSSSARFSPLSQHHGSCISEIGFGHTMTASAGKCRKHTFRWCYEWRATTGVRGACDVGYHIHSRTISVLAVKSFPITFRPLDPKQKSHSITSAWNCKHYSFLCCKALRGPLKYKHVYREIKAIFQRTVCILEANHTFIMISHRNY